MLDIKDAVYREWRVSPCYVQMQWVLKTYNDVDGVPLYMHSPNKADLERWIAARNAETLSLQRQAAADAEFREEVVLELIGEGKAFHVAMNLTNTQAKLMAEARRVGVI